MAGSNVNQWVGDANHAPLVDLAPAFSEASRLNAPDAEGKATAETLSGTLMLADD